MNWNAIQEVARKEVAHHFQNHFFLLVTVLLAGMNFFLIQMGFSYSGTENKIDSRATLLSLIHLQVYLLPLLALILSFSGVLAEREQGTLDLLLSYPLQYSDLILGKWIGYSLVFSAALLLGLAYPAWIFHQLDLALTSIASFLLYSIFLGISFLSIGLFLSSLSRDRTLVIAICISTWIFFVFLFDLGIISLLVLTEGGISDGALRSTFLFNPTGVFRFLATLALLPEEAASLFGLGQDFLGVPAGLGSLFIWAACPLALAASNLLHRQRSSS